MGFGQWKQKRDHKKQLQLPILETKCSRWSRICMSFDFHALYINRTTFHAIQAVLLTHWQLQNLKEALIQY